MTLRGINVKSVIFSKLYKNIFKIVKANQCIKMIKFEKIINLYLFTILYIQKDKYLKGLVFHL